VWPALLESGSVAHVQLYAAGALATKMQRQWASLPPDAQSLLQEQLWATVIPIAERCDLMVVRNVTAALAAASLQAGGDGVLLILQRVGELLTVDSGVRASGSVPPHITVAVELLRATAEQVDMQAHGDAHTAAVTQLTAAAPMMLSVMVGLLLPVHASAPAPLPLVDAVSAPASLTVQSARVLGSALTGFDVWSRVCDIRLHDVLACDPVLVHAAVAGAMACPRAVVATPCAQLLSTWLDPVTLSPQVATTEHLRRAALEETGAALLAALMLSHTPTLVDALHARGADVPNAREEDAVAASISVFTQLCKRHHDWLATTGSAVLPQDAAVLDSLPPPAWFQCISDADGGRDVAASCRWSTAVAANGASPIAMRDVPVGVGVLIGDALLQVAAAAPMDQLERLFEEMAPFGGGGGVEDCISVGGRGPGLLSSREQLAALPVPTPLHASPPAPTRRR